MSRRFLTPANLAYVLCAAPSIASFLRADRAVHAGTGEAPAYAALAATCCHLRALSAASQKEETAQSAK